MKRILMYSYKGGTGRTVATANVAAHLASRGNRVLCVDIDTAGPGMHVLFNVESGVSIQDYLADPEQVPIESVVKELPENHRGLLKGNGDLKVIVATTDYNKQEQLLPMLDFRKIGPALDKLCIEADADIVLIDSPSGYHEMTKAGLNISDHVIFFFRFSRQHILGTTSMGRFFNYCGINFSLVASAVPHDLSEPVRSRQERFLNERLKQVDQQGDGTSLIRCSIPEHRELKWSERILLFDEEFMAEHKAEHFEDEQRDIINQYERLAEHIEGLL